MYRTNGLWDAFIENPGVNDDDIDVSSIIVLCRVRRLTLAG
jgi:hypothetical protein